MTDKEILVNQLEFSCFEEFSHRVLLVKCFILGSTSDRMVYLC
jgi:hypothetical protein